MLQFKNRILLTFPLANGTLTVAMSSLETEDTISGLPVIERATSPWFGRRIIDIGSFMFTLGVINADADIGAGRLIGVWNLIIKN